jgi:hypothetical protein
MFDGRLTKTLPYGGASSGRLLETISPQSVVDIYSVCQNGEHRRIFDVVHNFAGFFFLCVVVVVRGPSSREKLVYIERASWRSSAAEWQ